MIYEVVTKRAERLLSRNFSTVKAEAHRLGGLGLPNLTVEVYDEVVQLELRPDSLPRGYWAVIEEQEISGGLLIQWQDGHWEQDGPARFSGLEAVSNVLQSALEEVHNLGLRMAEVKGALAEVK